jgi:hypothetical protein
VARVGVSILASRVHNFHVGWDPCHHGVAHPRVADGGKSPSYGRQLQIY